MFRLLLAFTITITTCHLCMSATPSLRRDGWSFDRSDLIIYPNTDIAKKRAEGSLNGIGGTADYDFLVTSSGWYELWIKGAIADWPRDLFLDGDPVLWLTTSQPEDASAGWLKEVNLYL